MNVEDTIRETKRLIGEPPVAPVLRDVVVSDDPSLEVNGAIQPGHHNPIEQDPNNNLLVQNYTAELADYTARFNKVFTELLKE